MRPANNLCWTSWYAEGSPASTLEALNAKQFLDRKLHAAVGNTCGEREALYSCRKALIGSIRAARRAGT
jgi:hypothetical protein